jgi:hypothetical protein
MKLASNWRDIVRRGWSFRLMLLVAVLGVMEAVFPFYSDLFDRTTSALITVGITLAALAARVVYQKGITK